MCKQSDKDLAEVKENFIEESQELALGNSKYLEYNQRFAIQREEYITKVLNDVNESNKKYVKLKADKNNVLKQVSKQHRISRALPCEYSAISSKCGDFVYFSFVLLKRGTITN